MLTWWDNELTGDALFTPPDFPALHAEYESKLKAAVDAFKQQNGLQMRPSMMPGKRIKPRIKPGKTSDEREPAA
jgi:hypothetical protein